MELSKTRYTLVLTIQLSLLFVDLLFNTFLNSFLHKTSLLLVFLFQDFMLLFTFVLMLITFFQTNVFQAGFMNILYEKFWIVIVVSLTYIILSVALHALTLIHRWRDNFLEEWSAGFYVCFIVHRLTSVAYYYIYKRTSLRISDTRLYEDEWINHIVHHKS